MRNTSCVMMSVMLRDDFLHFLRTVWGLDQVLPVEVLWSPGACSVMATCSAVLQAMKQPRCASIRMRHKSVYTNHQCTYLPPSLSPPPPSPSLLPLPPPSSLPPPSLTLALDSGLFCVLTSSSPEVGASCVCVYVCVCHQHRKSIHACAIV